MTSAVRLSGTVFENPDDHGSEQHAPCLLVAHPSNHPVRAGGHEFGLFLLQSVLLRFEIT